MLSRLLYVLLSLVVGFFAWFLFATQPVTPQINNQKTFEISAGASLNQIINNLSAQKLVRSRTAFKITVIRLGFQNKLQAGLFQLSPSMDATEIAKALTKAQTKQVRVTIPEGLRSQEINQILSKSFASVEGAKFNTSEFTTLTKDLEGKLFPDTYDFEIKATTQDVINKLTDQYHTVIKNLKITPEKEKHILVVASLLEREAANSSEMPQIAGVIEKRLANSWSLQIDATVQYALSSKFCKKLDCEWWKPGLTLADLSIDSPYNTYKNQGLPPAPISNPGKSALAAAVNPTSSSAWFYLHDPKGQIYFADSIEQHNKNVCLYLKKDCN
ncbi:hypothetical protein A2572_02925 [Candidatus Collierbacteria bacterium RIFOXYD1_FULL_40_9]|uniref:Endolytic murein transglycosylase n=1 Tax=Candidatus Collierbacteria bacterium RIFOXYD1_FULL_40_9 TaxID=1817731 RepID=A0A1F5FUU9_9BACT|nr:MAG: hypothetical protein A2572_02925 [Candidatus Collierbacteria bacterium RIFOXYD1_FULL_40_9]